MPTKDGYFTNTDAEILLLTHPDPEWRGTAVDCAYFQLTAGRGPVHIWNYARRSGSPAMSNQSQDERLDELQAGTGGGAPFDDTAESNTQVKLQIMLNEERFEETYYQFRSMSEIGNVQIKYEEQVSFTQRDSAGYVLLDGHVSTVSREATTRSGTYPSVEITFRDIRPIGELLAIDTSEFAPSGRQRGGPGVSRSLQGTGLGREPDSPAFNAEFYDGFGSEDKIIRPAFDNIPASFEDVIGFQYNSQQSGITGQPVGFMRSTGFVTAAAVAREPGGGLHSVWLWQGGSYEKVEPADEAYSTIQQKLR